MRDGVNAAPKADTANTRPREQYPVLIKRLVAEPNDHADGSSFGVIDCPTFAFAAENGAGEFMRRPDTGQKEPA
ncbi:hypothetical protein GCM10009077_27690 [Roseibium denhamense]